MKIIKADTIQEGKELLENIPLNEIKKNEIVSVELPGRQIIKYKFEPKWKLHKTISDRAECIFEPRGDNGLEGYSLGNLYYYELMYDKKGKYYRMYPTDETDYYETCGPNVFKKYFKIIE